MKRFFNSILEISQWIQFIQYTQKACPRCGCNTAFHSHGFVKKQISSTEEIHVGKRIFCCNRGNKAGCGATFQVYLTEFTRYLHFSIQVIACVFSALINPKQKNTHQKKWPSLRTQKRWISKAQQKLHDFKTFLFQFNRKILNNKIARFKKPLMNTLYELFHHNHNAFQLYQYQQQCSLLS